MSKEMKIYLYEVNNGEFMTDAINSVKNLAMEERVRVVSGNDMKLETIQVPTKSNGGVFFMDFCKHRDSGPGLAKKNAFTTGFNLASDEAFGEMTCVLYDPQTHFIVSQYNHYGPRPSAIAEYLSIFFDNKEECTFDSVLKEDVAAAIDEKQYNSSLSFGISLPHLTEEHKKRLGIGEALNNLIKGENVVNVEIVIKKERGRSEKMTEQKPFLHRLFSMSGEGDSPVTMAKVKGARTPEDKPEILDLINARVVDERSGLIKDPGTQMYSFQSRCKLLTESFNAWKEAGVITASRLR